jgi:hypothetical protein
MTKFVHELPAIDRHKIQHLNQLVVAVPKLWADQRDNRDETRGVACDIKWM